MINHTLITDVCVVNTHAGAGFHRRFDCVSSFVHNVTRPVENISARFIRAVLTNNKGSGRLIICRRPIRAFCDDPTGYRYRFGSGCSLVYANASGANSAQQARGTIVFFI